MAGRVKKWAFIGIGLVGLYALAGFYVLPAVLKSQLESKLPASLHRSVAIDAITFNPFTLTLTVDGFRATEPTGEAFLSFQHFLANLQISSLFQGSLNFKEIELQRPSVAFALKSDGTTNFSNLGAAAETPPSDQPATPPAPSKPLLIRIDALKLHDGQAQVEDQSRTKPYKTMIGPIDFEVTNFKTDPDWRHPHRFLARMDTDTVLAWSGNFSVTPFRSEGTIDLSGVRIPAFEPYYGDQMRARILNGVAALTVDYTLETAGQFALALRNGALTLTDLAIGAPQSSTPVITVPRCAVNGVDLDLSKRTLAIGTVDLTNATVVGTRAKDGTVDLQQLFAPAEPAAPQPATTDPPPGNAPSPWQIALDRAQIANAGLTFIDHVPSTPAEFSIDQLALTLQHIQFPESTPISADASLRWNRQGTLALTGTVRHTPVFAELDATLKEFALAPLQPYITDALFLNLTSGHLESATHLVYGPAAEGGAPTHVTGDFALLRLATTDARSGDPLVKLDALRFSKMDILTQPTRVVIDQIHLKNFQGQASTLKDGGFNVTTLRKAGPTESAQPPKTHPEERAQPAGAAEPPPSVIVRNIVLDNTALSVTDRTIQPPLSTGITQLTGRIQQLSYPTPAKTIMDLAGKADGRAPLRITGHVQPKGTDSQMDLLVSLKGYDVPVFTGYSSKYVGYPFQKGKLSLEMKYDVANRKLAGENSVLVDQLTLGPKSDSPDATTLPVKLALAILTDRQGQIHLDVPVGGDLDDPEFTFGRVILRALLNILEKVATSPFALLGSLAGSSGDAPNTIDFQPGTAELAPSETAKLDKLAKALDDRPALQLEVSASVDPAADRMMLAKAKVRRLLEDRARTAAQSRPSGKKSAAAPEPAAFTLDEVEYERMVRELHGTVAAAERTAQPGTDVTLDTLPPPPPPPPPPSGFWGFFKKLNPFGGDSTAESGSRPTTAPPPPAAPPANTATGAPTPAATGQPPLVPFAEIEAAVLAKQPVSEDDFHQLRKARTDAVLNYLTEQGHLGPDRVFAAADEAEAPTDAAQVTTPHATLKLN